MCVCVCVWVQSFAWSSCSEWSVGLRVPFVVDVCPMTFEQLDLLLRQVSEGMDGSSEWPPPQEKECMVVATLNLLRLQVRNAPRNIHTHTHTGKHTHILYIHTHTRAHTHRHTHSQAYTQPCKQQCVLPVMYTASMHGETNNHDCNHGDTLPASTVCPKSIIEQSSW